MSTAFDTDVDFDFHSIYDRDFGENWGGKPIKLFEAFLQKRGIDAKKLKEAGVTFQEARIGRDNSGRELGDELRESGSTSNFQTYLNDKATKRLMWGYGEISTSWRRYARTYNVSDFKPITFTRLGEMAPLLQILEGGEYKDSPLAEIVGPSITVKKFGRLFSLTREALINDDLNQLRDRPAALGRAAARTLATAVISFLEGNPAAYDGTQLFHTNHLNLNVFPLSEQGLADTITKLRRQKNPDGNIIGLAPRTVVVPPELELILDRILTSTTVPLAGFFAAGQPSTATQVQHGMGGTNVLSRRNITPVTEEYLTDPSDWYLFADMGEAPTIGVGFLNGVETPAIMLKDPGMRLILGGSDPYSMEYDEIVWKIRHEWGTAALDWRGAQKQQVP